MAEIDAHAGSAGNSPGLGDRNLLEGNGHRVERGRDRGAARDEKKRAEETTALGRGGKAGLRCHKGKSSEVRGR